MFELTEIKNYDTYHRYGTNWHTDYHFKTDKNLNFEEVIEELNKLGHNPSGELKLEENVLRTTMY